MEGERAQKRARTAGELAEADTSSAQLQHADSAAIASSESPPQLDELHRDALGEVMQQLGFIQASRLRLVSKKMRDVVDAVAWRTIRLRVRSDEQIVRFAAQLRRPAGMRPITLDVHPMLEVEIQTQPPPPRARDAPEIHGAVVSLFSACSACSGGLGGLLIKASGNELAGLATAVLGALSASEGGGGARQTLKSVVLEQESSSTPAPRELVRLLACFPRLERLRLPLVLEEAAAALPAAFPALRSAAVRLRDGAALAAFASHPALEELDLELEPPGRHAAPSPYHAPPARPHESARGFEAFAAGPAARRLRKLRVSFGADGFHVGELPALGRLTSLEKLQLAVGTALLREEAEAGPLEVSICGRHTPPREPARVSPDVLWLALRPLERLRELGLALEPGRPCPDAAPCPAVFRALAGALGALSARSLVALRLVLADGDARRPAGLPAAARAAPARHALAAVAGALAACPALEAVSGLRVPFDDEAGAEAVLGPLRGLAEGCRLGDGSRLVASLLPGEGLRGDAMCRAWRTVQRHFRALFPRAVLL
eukprot:tig00021238_g19557.t1